MRRGKAAGADNGSDRSDKPERKMVHIARNDCGEKGQYFSSRDCSVKVHIRKVAELYRESQKKFGSNRESKNESVLEKALVNVEGEEQHLIMGNITNDWDNTDTHTFMFCQTSSEMSIKWKEILKSNEALLPTLPQISSTQN